MSREDADLDRWADDATGDGSSNVDSTGESDRPASDRSGPRSRIDRPESRRETVELGVELLTAMADESLSVKAAVDRIETVTTDPAVTREILDTAETRGVIERAEGTVQTTGGTTMRLDRRTYTKRGDFDCRRCGAGLSTGHFVRLETGDIGPFGSTCIKKVTGRE